VNKYISITVIGENKAEPFCVAKPFYGSYFYHDLLPSSIEVIKN